MPLKECLTTFVRETVCYLQLRGGLLALEGKEAGARLGSRLIFLLVGLSFAGLAYLFLLAGGIAFLGHYLASLGQGHFFGWAGACLVIGTLHLAIALILLLKARKPIKEPLFPYTRSEWQKDQQWIQSQKHINKNL